MSDDTEKLVRDIYADVREIKTKLESDYRALYGNGQPGLVAKVANIERDLAVARARSSWFGSALAGWLSILAWLVTTAIALASLLKRG
jgi:hypothetical protein